MRASDDLLDERTEQCEVCGRWGVHVDTDAGEIVQDGTPYQVPVEHPDHPVHEPLMTGDSDGQDVRTLMCWDCAKAVPVARRVMQAQDDEGLIQPHAAESVLHRLPPEQRGVQPTGRAMARLGISQDVADHVADRLGWTDAPHVG